MKKEQKKQQKNTQQKKVPKFKQFEHKYKDKVVDFFNENEQDGLMFNKAPIVKSQDKKKKIEKKKKRKNPYEDDDSLDIQAKQVKQNSDIFQDQDTFFESFNQDFKGYFDKNKFQLKSQDKIQYLNYNEGTMLLAAVCDYGVQGKYLVLSLQRNKKAYVSYEDLSDNDQIKVKDFKLGQYVVGVVVQSKKQDKIQMSLKASDINKDLILEDLLQDQMVIAQVQSVEDYGIQLLFNQDSAYKGFIKNENLQENYQVGMNILVQVDKKEKKKKIVYFKHYENNAFKCDSDDLQNVQAQTVIQPGTLVNATVVRRVESGLIVKFLKVFIGYIFDDHAESYQKGQKFMARITGLDFAEKKVFLSAQKHILELQVFECDLLGQQIDSKLEVQKQLFGGSYLVKFNENIGFLHKSHLEGDIKHVNKIKVKEINYLEHYPILTAKKDQISQISFNDIMAGQIFSGVVQSLQKEFAIVQLMEGITGTIDSLNFSDLKKMIPKNIKVGSKVQVRVLSKQMQSKKINLTMKPILLKETEILTQKNQEQVNKQFYGYISGQNEKGYFVRFFNNIQGFLPFDQKQYQIGQTVQLFVTYISKKTGNLGLSLQKREDDQNNLDQFNLLPQMNNQNMALKINDVVKCKIIKKQKDHIVLSNKGNKVVLFQEHLSDFQDHKIKLFETYQENQFIQCKVIKISENKNVMVTAKKSLIQQKENQLDDLKIGSCYYFYVSKNLSNGIVIRFNEDESFFISKKSLDLEFKVGDTLLAELKSIKDNKAILKCQKHLVKEYSTYVQNFISERETLNKSYKYQVGQKVTASVTLIKDYGLILKFEDGVTGFILTDNLQNQNYKIGQTLNCQVLDIDFQKDILDMIEINQNKQKAFNIMLVKSQYLVGLIQQEIGIYVLPINDDSKNYQNGNQMQNIQVNQEKNQIKYIQINDKKQELKVGQKVSGVVQKTKKFYIYIQINKQFGRIHKSQFELGQFDKIEMNQQIECKVLSLDKTLELTCLNAHLNSDSLDKNPPVYGIVKSIQQQSIQPVYIELSGNQMGSLNSFGCIFDPIDSYKLNEIENHLEVGKQLQIQIIQQQLKQEKEFSNYDLKLNNLQEYKIEVGALVTAKIIKINQYDLRVQISKNKFGHIDILEVSDEWLQNPLKKYQINHYLTARIINIENDKIHLSARQTIIKNYQDLIKSTVSYKKVFSQIEQQFDFRSRLIKFNLEGLKLNQILIGYIKQTNDKGSFIKVGYNHTVRATLSELQDGIQNQKKFQPGKLVMCRIINVKEDGKIDVSLRESIVKQGLIERQHIQEQLIVKGHLISTIKENKFQVQIERCKFKGEISQKNYYEKLKIGQEIIANIVKFKENKMKIKLQNLEGNLKLDENQDQNINEIWASVQQIAQNNLENNEISEEEIEEEEDENDQEMELEDIEDDDDDDDNLIQLQNPSDDEEEYEDDDEEEENDEEEEDEEEEQSIQSSVDELENQKKLSKKQKQQQKIQKELQIRQKEQQELLDQNQAQSNDDYEKLILQNPNDSFIWINFIAFKMEKEGIQAARLTVERAIRVINFRDENEKINLWTSYLNLEYNFGQEQTLIKVFEKALQANNPKIIYNKLIEIYQRDNKYDIIFELSNKMIKKFNHSSKTWIDHLRNMLNCQGKCQSNIDLKQILQRCLQSVKKKKHIEILSHYAKLEFQNGDAEKGRTTFEALLNNYPKRTDIWSIYIDCEIKNKQIKQIRNLFERCIVMKLKPKKIQFFYKRYLEFEMQQGDLNKVEQVKQKAQDYVQSYMEEEN